MLASYSKGWLAKSSSCDMLQPIFLELPLNSGRILQITALKSILGEMVCQTTSVCSVSYVRLCYVTLFASS